MKVLVSITSLLTGLALLGFACASAHAAGTPATFNDPVPYCQAVSAIDAPDARYKGSAVPDWMVGALYSPDEIKAQKSSGVDPKRAVVWRCMGGAVYGCVQGNSPICGQANQDKTPTKRCANSALANRTPRSFRLS